MDTQNLYELAPRGEMNGDKNEKPVYNRYKRLGCMG